MQRHRFSEFMFAICVAIGSWFSVSVVCAQAIPVLERIDPSSGPTGTEVQIVGRAFDAATHVFIGAAECPVIAKLPNRWTVKVPEGATSGPLFLRNDAGQSIAQQFAVTPPPEPPTITRFDPVKGAPGVDVTIFGTNFSPRAAENVVTLGDWPVVVRAASPFELHVIVPEGLGTGNFKVRVARSGEAVSAATFNVTDSPTVSGFSPLLGPPGTEVTLMGIGFSTVPARNRVFINNVPIRVSHATPTEVRFTITERISSGPIVIDVVGASRAQSRENFQIQFPATIVGMDPAAAPPGRIVTLSGTNFGADIRAITAKIGDKPLVLRGLRDGTSLQVEIPEGATTGKIGVTVNGLGPAFAPREFRVLAPLHVTSVAPASGPIGSSAVIHGTGFSTVPRENIVMLAGVRCEVTVATATALTVKIPSANSGQFDIAVTDNGQTQSMTPFVITHPPQVRGFEPARVIVGGDVTIRGAGFGTIQGLVEVSVDGKRVTVSSQTDSELVVNIPPGTTSGRVTVNVRLQGVATTDARLEVVYPFSASAVEPAEGHVGTPIVVRGEGFLDAHAEIVFEGGVAVPATVVSATELRAIVPTGARAGALTVKLADGRTAAVAGTFAITETPAGTAITAIEAECTHPGCVARIRGYGFAARANQNRLTFGNVPVRITAARADSLTIALPARANTAATFTLKIGGKHPVEAASEVFAITQ